MAAKWSGERLFTELEPRPIDEEAAVANYDIVAGPDARLTGVFLGSPFAQSDQNYALHRTTEADPQVLAAIQTYPSRFRDPKPPLNFPGNVVRAARRHRLPIVHLQADATRSSIVTSTPAPPRTPNGLWQTPDSPTKVLLLGRVGLLNGVITTDLNTGQEYRLMFRAEYEPQRQDDEDPTNATGLLGTGQVGLFWQPSSVKFDTRAAQIDAGVWTPKPPRS